MKMRTFYTVGLSLCLVLTLAAPACAIESTPASVPETTEGMQEVLEGEPAQLPLVEIGLNENSGQESVQNPGELQNQNAPQGVDAEEGPEGVTPPGLAAEADGAQSQDGAEDSEQAEPPEEMQEPGGLEDTNNSQNADGTQASGTDTDTEEAQSAEEIPNSGEAEGSEILSVPQDTLDDGQDMIDVLVPASGQIIINPYRLEKALDGGTTTAQIIHQPQSLLNRSDIPVLVNVSVKGTVPEESSVFFVSAPQPEEMQQKWVFLYVEFQSDMERWQDHYNGAANQVLVTTDAAEAQGVLVLEPWSEGFFRFSGSTSAAGDHTWIAEDTFGAVLVFSFAVLHEGEDGTISKSTDGDIFLGEDVSTESDGFPDVNEPEMFTSLEDTAEPQVSKEARTPDKPGKGVLRLCR